MKKLVLLLFTAVTLQASAQSYCTAGPSSTFDSEITGVVLVGNTSTISNTDSSCGTTGVQDFTLAYSADISLGANYSIDIEMGTCGGNYSGTIAAWIDFNADGDFDDPDEQLGTYDGMPTVTQTFNFTVPPGAALGSTTLRVMQEEAGSSATIGPCNSFTWGAVEDYTIIIDTLNSPSCLSPTALSVSNIGIDSALVSYSSNGLETYLEYGPAGFTPNFTSTPGFIVIPSAQPYWLTGLDTGTSYDIYVYQMCPDSSISQALGPVNFQTLQCQLSNTCQYDFELTDSYGDGWNGAEIQILNATGGVEYTLGSNFTTGFSYTETVFLCSGETFSVEVSQTGFYPNEIGLNVSSFGVNVASYGNTFNTTVGTQMAQFTSYCNTACPAPMFSSLTATDSSATFTWMSSDTNFVVEYGLAGFYQGTGNGTVVSVNDTTVTVYNLSPNTAYDFYIQNDCTADSSGTSLFAGPYTILTPCVAASTPLYESFDTDSTGGFNNTNAPSCWYYQENLGAQGYGYISGSTFNVAPYVGNQMYFLYNSGDSAIEALISPAIMGLDSGNKQLDLYMANTGFSSGTDVIIGSVSSPTNLSNLNVIDTISVSNGATWNKYTVYIDSASGYNMSDSYLVIASTTTSTFNGVYIDEITVTDAPLCIPPTSLSLGAVGIDSAEVFFTSQGVTTYIEYGPTGFTPNFAQSTGVMDSTTSSPYWLSGLLPSTTYDVYFYQLCSNGFMSPSNGPLTLTTACGAFIPPFTEDFDSWAGVIPVCWSGIKTDLSGFGWTWDGMGTGSFGTGPLTGNSGDYYLYLETSGSTSNNIEYAYLPIFDLSTIPNAVVEFAYHMHGATMGDLTVEVSSDNINWTTLYTLSGQQHANQSDPYLDAVVDLTGYTSATTYIRFGGSYGGSFTGDMAIDDIHVGTPPPCPTPHSLSFVAGKNDATFSFNTNGNTGTFVYEWGPVGFAQSTGTTNSFTGSTTSNNFTINGLSSNSCYDVFMIADCGTNGVSDTVGPMTFCTNLCDTTELCTWTMSMYDSWGDGWNGAEVSLLLNGQQGPTFTFATGSSSIVDFQVCSGTQITVVNTQAGSFPQEVSYTLSNASGSQTTSVTTGNFAVGTQATLMANCVPVSCPMPSNIVLTNVTSSTAAFTWTGGSGTFIYDYREQGTNTMFNGTSSTASAVLTGLNQGTTYDFFLKEACAPGDTSLTAYLQFNTDSCFNVVIGSAQFNVGAVTATNAGVSFNWTGASYTGFNIVFGDGNSSNGTGSTVNHTYNANGNYTVTLTLYSDCDTASTTFNVQINGIGLEDNGGIAALMIYPNPTQGLIIINGELSSESEITVRIINYLGQEVLIDEFNPSSNVLNKTYDLSSASAGAYLIEIASDRGVVQKSIIIRH